MKKCSYLANPTHPITVIVIGAGGNGSQMLTQLARINHAMRALGMKGLHVTCVDDDIVTESNVGRQLFSKSDIGQFKSVVLIGRLNSFFGTTWSSSITKLTTTSLTDVDIAGNIIITCTDNKKSRIDLQFILNWNIPLMQGFHPVYKTYYWIDIGNKKDIGQVIMGSVMKSETPVPSVVEMFPEYLTAAEDENTPSCSLAEALSKQSLFVNTFVTNVAAELIWELLMKDEIFWHGAFINVETLNIKKLKCK